MRYGMEWDIVMGEAVKIYLSKEDVQLLEMIMRKLGRNKSEVFRAALVEYAIKVGVLPRRTLAEA